MKKNRKIFKKNFEKTFSFNIPTSFCHRHKYIERMIFLSLGLRFDA